MSNQRIPSTVDDIQVNFCKNPQCPNFGVPAIEDWETAGKYQKKNKRDPYIIASGGRGFPLLKCSGCGEFPPIKSNLAIREEVDRMAAYLTPRTQPSCPDPSCVNHEITIATPKAYYRFGVTKSGSQRYRCRACSATFAVGGPTTRQKRPEVNTTVFQLLVNKMPLKRICEVAGIHMPGLYGKIDFIHRQCMTFAGSIERKLPEMMLPRLYLSVDRQDYLVNWLNAGFKRNVQLTAVGSADNETGFVFGMHLNYDPNLDPKDVEDDAEALDDYSIPSPFRRFARLWLQKDYQLSLLAGANKLASRHKSLGDSIAGTYRDITMRDDVEASDAPTVDNTLPSWGVQVHSEYTLYGHFFFLRRLLAGVEKLRFYLDQESGIRAACLAAFQDKVMDKTCDAFYVRIDKEKTVNEKRKLVAESRSAMEEFRARNLGYEDLTDADIRHLMIKEEMTRLHEFGKWKDRWLQYPFPDMSEPSKAVCWLTDLGDRACSDDHLARLYAKATLHSIDRFFMQTRRRIMPLERPISSASKAGRRWHGYSPYNPVLIVKLLEIFRVFYNYVHRGDDKRTPAMRLGLTQTQYSVKEILEFQ